MPKETKSCCVIVGAGSGLGFKVAWRFAQGGLDIALISRNREKLNVLTKLLNSEGYTVQGFVADAAVEQMLESTLDQIKRWSPNIGVLIYNAAAMISDNAVDLTTDTLIETMALNLGGAICSVNKIVPSMRRRGAGTILITSGGLGLEPYPHWVSLSIGKAALRSYAISLHKALALEGIHVAAIAVCGIIEKGGLFDPERIADEYWKLHAESKKNWRRELVFLPEDADPYYNDPDGIYRSSSLPIRSIDDYSN